MSRFKKLQRSVAKHVIDQIVGIIDDPTIQLSSSAQRMVEEVISDLPEDLALLSLAAHVNVATERILGLREIENLRTFLRTGRSKDRDGGAITPTVGEPGRAEWQPGRIVPGINLDDDDEDPFEGKPPEWVPG